LAQTLFAEVVLCRSYHSLVLLANAPKDVIVQANLEFYFCFCFLISEQ